MSAPYAYMNSTLAGQNLAYLLVYANQVTNNMFGMLFVIAFFLIVFIGSLFMQLRFRATIKPETSFAAACFATLGLATVLQMYSGILSPNIFFILIGLTIVSVIALALQGNE